jgi:hypothetical protein
MFIISKKIILNPPELQGWQPNFNLGVLALVLKNATFHQLNYVHASLKLSCVRPIKVRVLFVQTILKIMSISLTLSICELKYC